MDIDGLPYVKQSLEEIQQRIFDIETELLPPQKEKDLKRELKTLKVIEKHLTGEIRKMEQLELFTVGKEA